MCKLGHEMTIVVLDLLPIPLAGLTGPGHAIKGDAFTCLDQTFIFNFGIL
jgi:hypothetical protein